MRAGLAGRYLMIVCPHLLVERDDVLLRPSFRRWFSEDDASEFVADLGGIAHADPDPTDPEPISRDADDDYLLALAIQAEADVLVSGDADLLALEDPPIEIITPRQLLDRLGEG